MKRNPPDLFLLLVTLTLLTLGLIIVFSASAPESLRITKGANVFHYGLRQLFFAAIGVVFMFIAAKFPYNNWRRLSPLILLTSVAFLIIVLFVSEDIKGSHRWINLGFFNFQPSEYAKLAIILILAHYITEIKKGITTLMVGVIIPFIFVGFICLLILLEPDLGTAMVIFATFMILIFAGGARLSHLAFLTLFGVTAAMVLVIIEPYRFKRLIAFLDPWKDPRGDGWQIIQSLYALGSGGPLGMGLGMSRQKFNYLPEAHTDYIFSILGEELGLLGTVTVIMLFFLLAWRGYKIAISAKDTYGKLLATGLTSYLIFQALLNIGVVTSSIPVTGITLPFLSYGGSSLMVSLLSVGILLNISKSCE
ncbi:MAG TPA: putative lipid II flippase FtsW [Bacillota bacterium]|nr:putative lipid II flippase FtsW [Bacillota bacterium]HPT87195.1 putative lipid II flippase FtsW [Bacillota bacterium]